MADIDYIIAEAKKLDNAVTVIEEPVWGEYGGVRLRIWFDNGYGASCVRMHGSYGGDEGLWELAVITGDDDYYELCYDTGITDDTIGWLTAEQAVEIIGQISELERR